MVMSQLAKIFRSGVMFGLILAAGDATALTAVEKLFASQLVDGPADEIREAAKSIYSQQIKTRDLLDIATEVLLQHEREGPGSGGSSSSEAFGWVCRAIAQSKDGRYRPALEHVAENTKDRKIAKHCRRGYRDLPTGVNDPYVPGSANLDRYRKQAEPATVDVNSLSTAGKRALESGVHPFSLVSDGMTMEEVNELVGRPSDTESRVTGKVAIPFYEGEDGIRQVSLYQGLGHIVYGRGPDSTSWVVFEIVQDESEPGYR